MSNIVSKYVGKLFQQYQSYMQINLHYILHDLDPNNILFRRILKFDKLMCT